MLKMDPTGNLFEENTWHELVHGLEGIYTNEDGELEKEEPWSYRLQQAMIQMDEEFEHIPDLSETPELQTYIQYLR